MAKDPGQPDTDEGSVSTRLLEDGIVETRYVGKITPEMAITVRNDIEPFLRRIRGLNWLVDASAATRMSPAPREATSGVIELFTRHGGRRIACVMPNAAIRMVASALAFGSGLPMKIFSTRSEALAYLRSR